MAVLAAFVALATPALAQSSVTYSLAGVETAATSMQGTFVGVARSADDFATWGAVIEHQPLDDSVSITGGAFTLDGQVRDVQGAIVGGQITRLTNSRSCRDEKYDVSGNLLTNGGTGQFEVTLTHYRFRAPGGGCVTYFATVEGLLTLTTAQ